MATAGNTTTGPPLLPQPYIQQCRGNLNKLCQRLAALSPNRTDVVLRREWIKSTSPRRTVYLFNRDKVTNVQAVLAHLAGLIMKEECISCAHGHGPFKDCVRISMYEIDRNDLIFMGACTNCRIGGEQSCCSLARQNEGKIPIKAFMNNRHVPKSMLEEMRSKGMVIDNPEIYKKGPKLVHSHAHRHQHFQVFSCSAHSEFYVKMSSSDPVSEVEKARYLAEKKAYIEERLELNSDAETRFFIQASHALYVIRSYFGAGTIACLLSHDVEVEELAEENGVTRDLRKYPNKLTFKQAKDSEEAKTLWEDRFSVLAIIENHSLYKGLDEWEQKDIRNALMFYYDNLYTNLFFRLLGLVIKFPEIELPGEGLEETFEASYGLFPRLGCTFIKFPTQESKAGCYSLEEDLDEVLSCNNERNFEQLVEKLGAKGFLGPSEDEDSLAGLEDEEVMVGPEVEDYMGGLEDEESERPGL